MEEEFCCPICLEVPLAEIFQCKNGHTICHNCYSTVKSCPQCRQKFGKNKIRCRALEIVLDKQVLKCANQHLGCKFKDLRAAVLAHTPSCPYREIEIELCQVLGYDCDFKAKSAGTSLLVFEHFRQAHGANFFNAGKTGLWLTNFKNVQLNKSRKWEPIFLEARLDEKVVQFMAMASIDGRDETLLVVTMCLDLFPQIHQNFLVQYVVQNEENAILAWTTNVVSVLDADKLATLPLPRIPGSTLKAKLAHNFPHSDLRVAVNILQTENKCVDACKQDFRDTTWIRVSSQENPPNRHSPADLSGNSLGSYMPPNISCDECKVRPIKGPYFHCLQCKDYDLCARCEQRGVHSFHLFTKIKNDMQYAAVHKLEFDNLREIKPILTEDVVVEELKCSECSKRGTHNLAKIFCVFCPKMYALCRFCFLCNRKRKTCLDHEFHEVNTYV